MPRLPFPKLVSHRVLSAGLLAMSIAPAAVAQQECGDTICDAGFECQTFEAACPEPECADGEDCAFECEAEAFSYCERSECTSDSDCGDYMVCAAQERWDCPEVDVACDADGPCEEPAEVECAASETQICTPPWELPCDSASDCGDGFTCEVQECFCNGTSVGGAPPVGVADASGSSSAQDGGAEDSKETTTELSEDDALTPEGECFCEPADKKSCRPVEQECESASDCPDNWECADNPGGACWADSEGNSGCDAVDPARLCLPPGGGFAIAIAESAVSPAASSGAAQSTASETASDPQADLGEGDSAGEDGDHKADSNEADADLSANDDRPDEGEIDDKVLDLDDVDENDAAPGENDEDTTTAEVASSDPGDEEAKTASKASNGGGCSVNAGDTGGNGLTLLLLGLGAAFSSRRRRARH